MLWFSNLLHPIHLFRFRYKGDSYELKGAADSTEGLTIKSDGRDTFKIIALYLHVLVIVGLSIAACVIIGIASHEGHDHDD